MASHHDTGYKELFSHPEFVEQLIDGFAPNDIAALMDFSTLQQQNGNNVELYVENETFAGNGSSTADLTQVTLTGVTGADLQDNLENGTLVLGTAADIA